MKMLIKSGLVALFVLFTLALAEAQEGFIGEIRLFAGNFAPRGWAFCDGQILKISDNAALYSIIGTTYGGDGRTSFALPDLRGRVPLHEGQGPRLSNHNLGQIGGVEKTKVNLGKSNSIEGRPYITLNYIICLNGLYPSRS